MNRYPFTLTTDASGDKTATLQMRALSAQLLYMVEWVDGDLADGVDAVISCTDTASGIDRTLLTLTNANDDAIYYPRELEDDNAGAELTTYGLPVVEGTLKVVVSSGGNAKTGYCYVYTMEV